mmetsp:Transcript_30801/g.67241  ORF Transcript_30801/g.67241 Transcript_30801/m.67241 type:complete len:82 (+) Transcript_30801:857-1102(+)
MEVMVSVRTDEVVFDIYQQVELHVFGRYSETLKLLDIDTTRQRTPSDVVLPSGAVFAPGVYVAPIMSLKQVASTPAAKQIA